MKESHDYAPWAGSSKLAPFCAYGDDTKYQDILLYAFIAVERKNVNLLSTKLFELKDRFSIPESTPIHTKDFFNGVKRKKFGIEGLNVPEFIDGVIDAINVSGSAIIYNYCKLSENGRFFSEGEEFNGNKLHDNHKAILHLMASTCFVPFIRLNGRCLTIQDFEVFVSKDTTRVKFIGEKERQAHFISEALVPITQPEITPSSSARFKPNYVATKENIHCQAADVVAYVLSHAISKKNRNRRFKKQMRNVRFLYRAPVHLNP